MKPKKSKILIYTAFLLMGIIIGAVFTALWYAKSLKSILEMNMLNYLAYDEEAAKNQYLKVSDIDTSIYALQHLINFIETLRESTSSEQIPKIVFHDLVVAYIRMGFLYEQKGEIVKANNSFKNGLEIALSQNIFRKWKGTDKEIKTIDELKKYVMELDRRLKNRSEKFRKKQ